MLRTFGESELKNKGFIGYKKKTAEPRYVTAKICLVLNAALAALHGPMKMATVVFAVDGSCIKIGPSDRTVGAKPKTALWVRARFRAPMSRVEVGLQGPVDMENTKGLGALFAALGVLLLTHLEASPAAPGHRSDAGRAAGRWKRRLWWLATDLRELTSFCVISLRSR